MKTLATFAILLISVPASEAKSSARFTSSRDSLPVTREGRAVLQLSKNPQLLRNPKQLSLASIALNNCPGTTGMCLMAVRKAVQEAKGMPVRGVTSSAKDFGPYLVNLYGAQKLPISNPYKAQIGSIVIYPPRRGHRHGHIEIVTSKGFVSDHISSKPFASHGAIYAL